VARYIAFVKSSRPIQPNGEVLVPGEPELRMRAARANGVPLPDNTWAAMVTTARTLGVEPPHI
jgi:hydroxycarboxylate dehydrogenase B